MLGLLILDYKIGYRLWFVCQWIQFMIWFLELDISCDFLATDTIDDLILYLWSEEEHALDF